MSRQITLIAGEPQEFYEVGDFVRILAATDPLTIEFYSAGREIAEAINVSKGYAEKFDLGTFDRVRLVSATTQAVQFVTRLGNVVQYDAAPIGDTAIVSSVPLALNAATLQSIKTNGFPLASTGAWRDASSMVAGSPLTVFTAAANVNGAIILSAEAYDYNVANLAQAFIAKATAPGSVNDGEVIAQSHISAAFSANLFFAVKRETPARIAPGLGLYFISSNAGSAGYFRNCRYVLL